MSRFLPGFEEFEEERRQQSAASYDVRMLKRMLLIMTDENTTAGLVREGGDEFGFLWFNEAYNPPVHIVTSKLRDCALDHLLAKSLMRKSVGKAFLDARATCDEEIKVGVVFPILNRGNWIITDSEVRIERGVAAVVRGGDNSKLFVVPFDDFSEGFKLAWQP
jgi:hypothetical protein